MLICELEPLLCLVIRIPPLSAYENLGIWDRNIGPASDGQHRASRERLRAIYRQFWSNSVILSREIQRDLPQLTLHDETHFEALWRRADQIAGDNYYLTPLEVFVLGGAILLHDAANSLAAYPGGLAEIQSTPEWSDAAENWLEQSEQEPSGALPPHVLGNVLLETLRAMHAERARTMASFEVTVGSNRHALLQDDQLRAHLGPLIGEIAASHHWDSSKLQSRLGGRRGSLAGMPESWTIRPVLIACLLRCADATQLDQDRAPDFLYGLLRLHGLSEQHWRAQNRLAHPHVDADDLSAMVFSSTHAFTEADVQAWWLAHDAIQIAHHELQTADNLVRDERYPAFQLNRIRGAESPQRLSSYLRVEGWRPVTAEVKATRVDKIVDMFGGEQLYGQHMFVPIRELIQNAADAIRFRRELEPASAFEGRITVRLREQSLDGDVWIDVEDDGLGMSEAVMTGPLIDFGSSYISSSLVKSERPGLLSKGRKRIGKFGIGFFSSFMISDEVSVTSRPFDRGLDACCTLRFSEGTATRPVLLDGTPAGFSSTLSTKVTLSLNRAKLATVLTLDPPYGGDQQSLDLFQLVGALCPMLNVDVYVAVEERQERVHSRRWYEEDREEWLKRLLPGKERQRGFPFGELEAAAKRLTFIDPSDPAKGLAAVAAMGGTGVATVGTLRVTSDFGQVVQDFSGAIDHEPAGPRRGIKQAAAASLVPAWATQQAELAASMNIPMPQRLYIAQRVARFEGDGSPIAFILFEREWISLETALTKALERREIYVPVQAGNGKRVSMAVARERHSGLIDNYKVGELEYLVPAMEGDHSSGSEEYYAVPTLDDPSTFSFLSMFNRLAQSKNISVTGEFFEKVDFARYVGPDSPREGLPHGKLIGCSGLKLTVRPG